MSDFDFSSEDDEPIDREALRTAQRNFYLYLSPVNGHELANDQAGFIPPDSDSAEIEIRDILSYWLRLQAGKAGTIIANCSWWMLSLMDEEIRTDAGEAMESLDQLVSFLVSSVRQLEEAGVIEIKENPSIPDIKLSTSIDFDEASKDMLKQMEEWLKLEKDKEEDTDE